MSISQSWVGRRTRAADRHREAQLERQRLLADGLPAEHLDPRFTGFSLSQPGRSSAAKRSMSCPLCDIKIERGDTVRPVALNVFAHWQCLAEYQPKSPRAWNQAARVLSRMTELRRRVFWAVECGACGAGVHQACRNEHGVRRGQNHRVRMLAYSKAKRERQQVADAGLLAEIRVVAGKTGLPWVREKFLEQREALASGSWRIEWGVVVDHHGMPVVRT